MKITFKEFYEGIGIKDIVNKINGGSKNSKLSSSDVTIINSVLDISGKSQIKGFCINTPDGKSAENSAQQAFVDLTKVLCSDLASFDKLDQAHWFYSEADLSNISNITKRYGKIKEDHYIYKDAEVTLLMARSLKLLIDCNRDEDFDKFNFEFVVKDNLDIKTQFYQYIGSVDSLSGYNKSYKLVFYKTFFENSINGKIEKYIFADRFLAFYVDRINKGLKPDFEVSQTIANADESTTESALVLIINNPFNAISSKGFFECDDQYFKINEQLLSELNDSDVKEILDIVDKKLELYYEGHNSNNTLSKEEGEEELSTRDTIEQIKKYITSKGFSYDNDLIENFYLSLKSKPFVILAGTSGTGKTKLVKLFSEAIGARYKLVSVRPDWSDSTDLFGHTNLHGEFVKGAITEYVKEAQTHQDYPYFLCLDEMNLARVEYYLSDFLSLIETRKWENGKVITEPIELDQAAEKDFKGLYLPENLYIIGTVNMDETTFPFSKKVLDRANTIEFSYVDLVPDFDDSEEKVYPVPQNNAFLKTAYLNLKADIKSEQKDIVVKVCDELQAINKILQEANSHVGYRVRDEIVFYILNNESAELLSNKDALDNEIMQKILPRIQGSSNGVKELLCKLFKKFAGDYSSFSQDLIWKQMDSYIKEKNCTYKNSATKICYMMRRYEEDGFTSYWL